MPQTLRTALIVDDDHLEREYLSELLFRSGFAVRTAASVPNAAALVKTMRFDCFFIDDRMSGYDGATALRELLRTVYAERDAEPVSFLLGDARDESAQHFKENGFAWFLEKPVDIGRLRTVLDTDAETAAEVLAAQTGSAADRIAVLRERGGFRTESGVANCGSEENYLSALEIFSKTITTKAEEIERYYEGGDWKNYTVKVHALKSSARIIGAQTLSEQAADLEDAGNRGDVTMIREDTPTLLQSYRALREKLSPLFETGEDADDRPAADPATVADAFHSIAEFAGQMDYDLVEMVLKSMEEYRLEQADADRLSRIRTALLSLDWDGVLRETGAPGGGVP